MKKHIIPKKELSYDCWGEDLTGLKLHTKLEALDCSINNLTRLKLNKHIFILYCRFNNINALKLNNKLLHLGCDIFVNIQNINNENLSIVFE